MTRFSEEYIDFVTKAEAIQAAWQKRGARVGDWVWALGLKRILLVQRVTDKGLETSLGLGLLFYDEVAWLPTLSDLLEALEKVRSGRAIRLASDPSSERTSRYWLRQGRDYASGRDWELAAARLLERAVEKEKTDE